MKNLILLSSILLLGCGEAVPVNERLNDDSSKLLANSDKQEYDAQKSLGKILDSGDSREVVYLVHPTDELLTFCYHDVRSECYIEGVHNSQFFKYDISQVEGQNMGKLTFHIHDIESSKTTPTEWMTINDKYVQVLMTSKIVLNSKQHTLYEPLVIDYEAGMMVR